MVATILMRKCTGASAGTETTVTSIALKTADDATGAPTEGADAVNHPVSIPVAGTSYSYETWLRWECTSAPVTQCTSFKFWSSGSVDTGTQITANTTAVSAGVTPVVTVSAAGTRANWSAYSSASKISVSGTLTGTGQKTNYIVLQLEVGSTATQGNMATKTAYYSYDEN